jgi:hypothetical protein
MAEHAARPSSGAVVAVVAAVVGAVALTVAVAPLLALSVGRVGPTLACHVREAAVVVKWDESEGTNNDGGNPLVFSVLAIDGGDGADLAFVARRRDLGFDRIEKEAEGWPPDLGTMFENGLNSYSIEVAVKRDDGTESTRTARAIGATASRGAFLLLVPREDGDGVCATTSRKVVKRFAISAEGVIELAKWEKSGATAQ